MTRDALETAMESGGWYRGTFRDDLNIGPLPQGWVNSSEGTHMQFMLLAYDGTDTAALARRMAVREQHIALGDKLVAEGKALYGTAILDDNRNMIGSMYILEYDSRAELDKWLEIEPYVTGDVWRDIQIRPVRVGPSFAGLRKQ